MSLIVSIRTGEGVVMASDSRMTTTVMRSAGDVKSQFVGAHFSDTTYKTFMLGGRIGVSTCGDAFIKGRAVAGWMQEFESVYIDGSCTVLQCAQKLAGFFGGLRPSSELIFHIGGYQTTDKVSNPVVYRLCVNANGSINLPPADTGCGARWDGQQETLTRILKSCYVVDESKVVHLGDVTTQIDDAKGGLKEIVYNDILGIPHSALHFPDTNIDFSIFTLQDAVDFAMYAIKTTIDTMRFKSEPLTVSEPIDVLIITPTEAKWLAHKTLHV